MGIWAADDNEDDDDVGLQDRCRGGLTMTKLMERKMRKIEKRQHGVCAAGIVDRRQRDLRVDCGVDTHL